jgi:alkylhydroperoxidase family enzyme
LLGSEELVWGVLRDLETSALPENEKALLRFVGKVNLHSPEITAEDMKPLYQAGWGDDAIYYAITVCSLFNFYNRWIDASGVHALSDEAHRIGGKRTAAHGYVRK